MSAKVFLMPIAATFARDFAPPIATRTGTPVSWRTVRRISRPMFSSSSGVPRSPTKDSSTE